jgi:hypothetical protein
MRPVRAEITIECRSDGIAAALEGLYGASNAEALAKSALATEAPMAAKSIKYTALTQGLIVMAEYVGTKVTIHVADAGAKGEMESPAQQADCQRTRQRHSDRLRHRHRASRDPAGRRAQARRARGGLRRAASPRQTTRSSGQTSPRSGRISRPPRRRCDEHDHDGNANDDRQPS